MTQTSQSKTDWWSEPEPALDEKALIVNLSFPLTFQYLQPLLVSNMFAVQAAFDRRATRENFSDLLICAMNFNSYVTRAVTMDEAAVALENKKLSFEWLKSQEGTSRNRADTLRKQMIETLKLLHECREPGEPVS
jgi:hypothetical protein